MSPKDVSHAGPIRTLSLLVIFRSDPFTVNMETVTAFVEGPLCFLAVWAFLKNHPSRYLLQLVVSIGQLYGCVLYFSVEWQEDFKHGPKFHPLYFWFYFFFMNVLWIVIPSVLIVNASQNLMSAQAVHDGKKSKSK